ncbi:MAG: hypothetical protein SGBAC_004702 [Bacillariaceae sp.]
MVKMNNPRAAAVGLLLILMNCCALSTASMTHRPLATTTTKQFPSSTSHAVDPSISSTSTSLKAAATVSEPDDDMFKPIRKRRPELDSGLRYSSNDWLINLLLTPTSYILKRVRTSSAYARFWEARGHWTNTKATCRNLAMMMKTHIGPSSPNSTKKFMKLLAAYPFALMHLCLGGAAYLPEFASKLLPKTGVDYQFNPSWPGMLICTEMQKTLHEAEKESKTAKWNLIESAHHSAASHMIDGLIDKLSNCEKILNTPVPWSYSRHTSRFLSLWIGTLPLALIGTVNKWLVLPITIAAGYAMLGIEEIGHCIEQPFLGDKLEGENSLFVSVGADGEASDIITRGRKTQPYDIGIPVCSLALQIRKEVQEIASLELEHDDH